MLYPFLCTCVRTRISCFEQMYVMKLEGKKIWLMGQCPVLSGYCISVDKMGTCGRLFILRWCL